VTSRVAFRLRTKDVKRVFDESLWKDLEIKEHVVDNHTVVDVHLTEDMLITALTIGIRCNQKAKKQGFIENIKGSITTSAIGLEGVFALAAYIYGNWLTALDYVVVGKGDDGDVVFNGHVLDVKTRSKSFHDLMMIPKRQWIRKRQKYDFYVGCNELGDNWVRIWGFIDKHRLNAEGDWRNMGYGDTLCIPFKKLTPITKLKEMKQKGGV
jgi:hypothetical protein